VLSNRNWFDPEPTIVATAATITAATITAATITTAATTATTTATTAAHADGDDDPRPKVVPWVGRLELRVGGISVQPVGLTDAHRRRALVQQCCEERAVAEPLRTLEAAAHQREQALLVHQYDRRQEHER
jgi:hypothetical protein